MSVCLFLRKCVFEWWSFRCSLGCGFCSRRSFPSFLPSPHSRDPSNMLDLWEKCFHQLLHILFLCNFSEYSFQLAGLLKPSLSLCIHDNYDMHGSKTLWFLFIHFSFDSCPHIVSRSVESQSCVQSCVHERPMAAGVQATQVRCLLLWDNYTSLWYIC